MAMTPEGKVKAKIFALLYKYGIWYFSPRGTAMGRSGIPDIICCAYGRFLAIEVKASRASPVSALQNKEIADIRMHGGIAGVACDEDLDKLEDLLKVIARIGTVEDKPTANATPQGVNFSFQDVINLLV